MKLKSVLMVGLRMTTNNHIYHKDYHMRIIDFTLENDFNNIFNSHESTQSLLSVG